MRKLKIGLITIILLISGFAVSSSFSADENLEFIPGEDSGFYYIIQKGDTLWDLSQKFYNSEWDWPGLWEMNDEIKNPHWIYPGRKIKIFYKDKGKLKPIIVPVKAAKKPPITEKIKPAFSYAQMDAVGFLKKEKQPDLGSIIKEKDDHVMMGKDDIIYIKPSGKGVLIPGKTYQVFSVLPVEDKIDEKEFKGFRHLIKANVDILEDKTDYVVAKVTKGYRPIFAGDFIMNYYKRNTDLEVNETPPAIDARIICSEDDHLMINDYIIGFINAGGDQVSPGEIYTVLRTNEVKDYSLLKTNKKDQINLENIKSGKLIVLHTEDIASTVIILSSEYAIHPNDIVN